VRDAETVTAAAARAEALLEVDRHAEAVPLLERALAAAPDDEWLLDLLAQAQLVVDPQAALETAGRLAQVDPQSHRGPLLTALAYGRLGDQWRRVESARRAVVQAPWHPAVQAYYAQSLVGRRGNALKEARAAAATAIELAPEDSIGYVTAGNVELGRGRVKEAEAYYRRALEVDPTSADAQAKVALIHGVQGRLNHAYGDVESLLRVDPRDPVARVVLDETIYATLVHLQWIVIAVAFLVGILKDG
jgi:tetratricopeptide (TPR) repeat protein